MQDIDTLLVGAHEVGIALEAAVVAAESLGLGTVPIGDVRKNALEIVHELQLPEYVFPMLGMYRLSRRKNRVKASVSTTGCLFEESI